MVEASAWLPSGSADLAVVVVVLHLAGQHRNLLLHQENLLLHQEVPIHRSAVQYHLQNVTEGGLCEQVEFYVLESSNCRMECLDR